MRRLLAVLPVAALVVACTVQSDKMDNYEATRAYIAPSLCARQQQCEPLAFTLAHCTDTCVAERSKADDVSNAEGARLERAECERRLNEEVRKQELKLTPCTNEEFQQCRADMQKAPCPTDPAKGGVPELPPSCAKC